MANGQTDTVTLSLYTFNIVPLLQIKHTDRITVYNELFKIIHYHALLIHYEKQNSVIRVSLLRYKQRSLLHVLATYCGHLRGSVL
jgi:hypothetical protein